MRRLTRRIMASKYYKVIQDCYVKGKFRGYGEILILNDTEKSSKHFQEISKQEYEILKKDPNLSFAYVQTEAEKVHAENKKKMLNDTQSSLMNL